MKFLNSEWHWRSRKIIEALLFDCLSPQNQVSERIMNLEKGLEIVACWKEFKPEIQHFSFNIVPVKHGVVARASMYMLLCFHYNVSLLRSLFDGKGITESHFFFLFQCYNVKLYIDSVHHLIIHHETYFLLHVLPVHFCTVYITAIPGYLKHLKT